MDRVAVGAVLESALKAGLDAPYACLGGACGTCMAKVLLGSVAMEQNLALAVRRSHAGCHEFTPAASFIASKDRMVFGQSLAQETRRSAVRASKAPDQSTSC